MSSGGLPDLQQSSKTSYDSQPHTSSYLLDMVSLALTGLAAALVASVTANPLTARDFSGPSGLSQFQLTTVPNGGNSPYSGWWPVAFHTGAGTNAAVLSSNQSETLTWRTSESLFLAQTTTHPE
ncbi:hypothetical protein DAEQUDRAFT_357494 [Daedalea quercina L-15889]|uniref:DUF7907 domain-containing protein n=1 Tax=Daedalea quercina L-15889 TaxID=1314783 RepID=A0A165TS08_9APHY|nr:hypothetical protein DAEQUDRAFT_357494 [Daedalea quercina L-15889]